MANLEGTRSLQLFFSFLFVSITSHVLVVCQDVCRLPHDIREASKCTSGFASSFHIEVLEDQADLHEHDARQVLIPAMNFNCNGALTKWIFPARWEGNSQAFTELQIWRRTNSFGSVYFKIGATTIQTDTESANRLYEIAVDPPLEFQAGDIIGYFQPHETISQLNIYLEDSEKIETFRDNVGNEQRLPPNGTFDLGSQHLMGQDYPLIGADTDPPNCGCGLVTTERMIALLTLNREDFGTKNIFPQEQMIFPNSQFTCSGHVVKWIVGATFMANRVFYPELQIWRPISNTTFQRLNGTITAPSVEAISGIYEFVVDPPLPVKPGDILGVFQPPLLTSGFLVDFDSAENAMNFFLILEPSALTPSHTFIDVGVGGWQRGTILPLVTAEISLDAPPTTTPPNLVTTPAQTTTIIQLIPTQTTTSIQPTPTVATTGTPNPVTTQTATFPNTQTLAFTQPVPTTQTGTTLPVLSASLSMKPGLGITRDFTGSAAVQTYTNTQVEGSSLQTTSISISVDSANTSTEENLMFYVGLGVVGMLVALVIALIIILMLVLLYPKKGDKKQKSVQLSPEPSNSPEYELYADTTDAPASMEPTSPNDTEQVFDDPIYNALVQQNSNCNLLDIRELYSPNDSSPNPITAYAISNVHCTTNRALVTAREPNGDYDYAEP